MKIIGTGFLTPEGRADANRFALELTPITDLVEKAINLCHKGLESVVVTEQQTDEERQRLISCVVLARLLEIGESMVVLAKGCFPVEVSVALRVFLDAYFIFGNVCKAPGFIPQYFGTDLRAREKLINAASKHKAALFEPINQYATAEVRKELGEDIASKNAEAFSSYGYAANVGCTELYDGMYRITSLAVHSMPRSLAGYVTEDANGSVTALIRGPQLGDIRERLLDLGCFLLNVRSAFDELFGLDSTAAILELRELLGVFDSVETETGAT